MIMDESKKPDLEQQKTLRNKRLLGAFIVFVFLTFGYLIYEIISCFCL